MPRPTQNETQNPAGGLGQLHEAVGEAVKPKPKSKALPDWLTNNPQPSCYHLTMADSSGDHVNSVPLTRNEFKALKVSLARLRGFETPEWYELFDDHLTLEPDPADHPYYASAKEVA